MLNMPRHAMFDVDIRPMFIARPGYKLVISDYAQIEPRLLLWKVGDTEFVDLIKKEGNIYIAYARRKWDRIILPKTTDYQLVKAQVLSLNYYCGPDRFMNTANKPPYNLGLTLDKAKEIVYQYRDDNPLIKGHWDEHQKWLMFSANHSDKSHEVELPSGRVLKYFNPYWEKLVNKKTGKESWEITAQGEMGGHRTRLHSGVLTNNEIQGAAYDILSDAGVALYKEGYKVLWSVYDEFIMEVPEDKVEGSIPIIEDIMCNSSPWAKGCPLAVETNVSDFYYKA
jgi:DNA polymerase